MSNRLEKISKLLLEEVNARFDKEPPHFQGVEWSDNFAEMLEKYIILHIRMWKLEDACAESSDPQEVFDLKRKLDFCFKDRRPKLTKAINQYLDAHINKEYVKKFDDGNVKQYKGFENKN
jgi:hypothetical protein|tara:strand:+ start:1390 stop:1749 length:360 start_codon:yes stop_codon:yes gene_type:complete